VTLRHKIDRKAPCRNAATTACALRSAQCSAVTRAELARRIYHCTCFLWL